METAPTDLLVPRSCETALMAAGLLPDAARRRTICLVYSLELLKVRASTRVAGELVPAESPLLESGPYTMEGWTTS